MNRIPRNYENEQNVHGLRKITYWEKYGVKRFPYPGRRRYTPLVYQSEDEGIIISNDVFGLTIKQFERTYKACLDRRKTQEQYILNLRYPDKSTNEYLEYLQDSTDCNKDYVFWTGNDLKEKYLYEHLVTTAGTEIDIRKRQQLFITQDMIHNSSMQNMQKCVSIFKKMFSGSQAEGLDLPGSDIDIMYVIEDVNVIPDARNIKSPDQRSTLVMENDNDYPGFTCLRLVTRRERDSYFMPPECFESTRKGSYLSVNTFLSNMNKKLHYSMFSLHGPCLSDDDQYMDLAFCLRSKYLPYNAIPWASRYRWQWPPNSVIDKIKKYGCLLVPIGPRTLPDCNILWRLSFSVAEKLLVYSFNFTQLLCYCLLKLTLKHIVNTNKHVEGLLCSYFLKTALFWVSEEIDIDTFQLSKLYSCFSHCLSKLIEWVKNCYCPNYFIPEQNMFLGKISPDNNKILIHVLDSIKFDGIDGMIQNLCQQNIGHHRLLRTQLERSCVMLDLLFYRISHLNFGLVVGLSQCLKFLKFTEYLLKSKSYTFIVDACKYRHAELSQYAAQLLPTQTVTTEMYNIHKLYHIYLKDGFNTDAVSGWVLYASFYYVTGRFNVTLRLVDYVLSKYSPNMVPTGCQMYHDRHINYYRNHVYSTITLKDKMRMAVLSVVKYLQHSSLMPKELQMEVKDQFMVIPSIVMCNCLKFLCYHHIGDIVKKNQALFDLCFTVEKRHLIDVNTLSNSITILGVCFEIYDYKDLAYHCYDDALQCDSFICVSAKARRSKLLTDLV
ncbi:unnamed protein product [Mytilus coruscus]|uniref:Mab-21-like HhH/H2TH-like domain-containing protein n=1 Tax=Mytilus coruscus TaxID=42192 RepID=A0A6J8ABG9_MYTCO|nr:unnamed protein product [Mytilus coruscus]